MKLMQRATVMLGVAISLFAVVLPTMMLGQTIQPVQPADLVGAWVDGSGVVNESHIQQQRRYFPDSLEGKTYAYVSTFTADGNYSATEQWLDGNTWRIFRHRDGRWKLVGDTLQTLDGSEPDHFHVARKGPQLLLWDIEDRAQEEACAMWHWDRFDPAKPLTIRLPAPPASKLTQAAVVGTWVSSTGRDSIVLHAKATDKHTWAANATITINGKRVEAVPLDWQKDPAAIKWEYGDQGRLWLSGVSETGLGEGFRDQQLLLRQDGKLLSCSSALPLPLLTHVAP